MKNKSKIVFALFKDVVYLIFLSFGILINANDRIEKLISRTDIDKLRVLFDSDILLRAEDKNRYINLGLQNVQNLKSNIEKKKLDKNDLTKIAYGIIGLYAFSKSLVWLNFFKIRNDSAVDLHAMNTNFSKLGIDPDEETEYELEITTAFKYLSYAASSLLFYFSIKQLYEGLTRKFRMIQYKKAVSILSIIDRMAVRKDIDRNKINDVKVL